MPIWKRSFGSVCVRPMVGFCKPLTTHCCGSALEDSVSARSAKIPYQKCGSKRCHGPVFAETVRSVSSQPRDKWYEPKNILAGGWTDFSSSCIRTPLATFLEVGRDRKWMDRPDLGELTCTSRRSIS